MKLDEETELTPGASLNPAAALAPGGGSGMPPMGSPMQPENMPVHKVPHATYHHKGTVHKGHK